MRLDGEGLPSYDRTRELYFASETSEYTKKGIRALIRHHGLRNTDPWSSLWKNDLRVRQNERVGSILDRHS